MQQWIFRTVGYSGILLFLVALLLELTVQASRGDEQSASNKKPDRAIATPGPVDSSQTIENHSEQEREAIRRLGSAMAKIGHWVWDIQTDSLSFCSEEVAKLFGLPLHSLIDEMSSLKHYSARIHPDDRDRYLNTIASGRRSLEGYDIEFRILRPDTETGYIHVREVAEYHQDCEKGQTRAIGIVQDISDAKNTEEQLRESRRDLEQNLSELHDAHRRMIEDARRTEKMAEALSDAKSQLSDAIESISEGFALWDKEERLVMCNSCYLDIYPALSDILVRGVTFENFIASALERKVIRADDQALSVAIGDRLRKHRDPGLPSEHQLGNGRWVRVSKRKTKTGHVVSIVTDITELKRTEAQVRRMALEDPLTGLPNRTRFRQRLEEAVAQSVKTDCLVGVMLLDLDQFKAVNDTLGHPGGDVLLKYVAGRILNAYENPTPWRVSAVMSSR